MSTPPIPPVATIQQTVLVSVLIAAPAPGPTQFLTPQQVQQDVISAIQNDPNLYNTASVTAAVFCAASGM